MQVRIFSLTAVVTLASFSISLANANEKSQPKQDEGTGQNFIITHYGLEYYTPVDETAMQKHNGGYFTAEVIPVNVNTGEELKTVNNLYVPLHTGYSIGVSSEDASVGASDQKDERHNHSPQLMKVLKQSPSSQYYTKTNDKKIKTKYANTKKKTVSDYSTPSVINDDSNANRGSSSNQTRSDNIKKHDKRKRYAQTKDDEKFVRFFSTPNFEKMMNYIRR